MATHFTKKLTLHPLFTINPYSTSSATYVASRFRDPTFEKLMDKYKNLLKIYSIQDLILANPTINPPSISINFLTRLSQKLHLNKGPTAFLRKYPHIFEIFYDPINAQPLCKLTPKAVALYQEEGLAIEGSMSVVIDRLVRILSMSVSKRVPLRAVFKVWRELGLPDDFEDSVISKHPHIFRLSNNVNEVNTHMLELVRVVDKGSLVSAVENWRVLEVCKEDCSVDRSDIRFSFKHGYPPGMKLKKNFRAKVREWQSLEYIGPYDEMGVKSKSKRGMKVLEKRAVGIVHEFLSLTVEKMVEVEKISHFRSWFGIELNIRDLFLDHPGMFYLSTKGKRHTVFLREAYERGCLIDPNPVYVARRNLLELVAMGKRGFSGNKALLRTGYENESESDEEESD
ncbi:hypothetical protein ACET3Z_003154 [Daucus carota]